MEDNETKCLIWNEKNPKIISTKFIPTEGLVKKPMHSSMSQIKQIEHEKARRKNGLLVIEEDIKDTHHDPSLIYVN